VTTRYRICVLALLAATRVVLAKTYPASFLLLALNFPHILRLTWLHERGSAVPLAIAAGILFVSMAVHKVDEGYVGVYYRGGALLDVRDRAPRTTVRH